jgi:hypothetical protein
MFSGLEPNKPEKCAHLAGESNTVGGYSTGFTPTIFILSVTMSIFDMQKGHA